MSPDLPSSNIRTNQHSESHSFTQSFASDRFRRNAFVIACVLVAAVKIWLTLAFGMRAVGEGDADDRLFVILASHLINGEWLGPYNLYTLVKGPFFSMWIAGTFFTHIPLLLSYQLLDLAACALLVIALRTILPERTLRFALFILLLFDPSTYGAVASWVVREGIYISLTMIVLACVFALLTRYDQKPARLVGWSLGLGVALAAFWTTREEGIWILPALAVAIGHALLFVWRKRNAEIIKTALLLLPAGICAALVFSVCALNKRYYGVFEIVEFKNDAFMRANGALMRVNHDQWNQFAAVPKHVRQRIYEVSPTFAELSGYLEGPQGEAWGRGAEAWLRGGTPNHVDIRGGFFVWALRQAAESRGYHNNAVDAQAFYARIADEINSACSDGRLDCGPRRDSMTPPWRSEYAPLLLESFGRGLKTVVTLSDVTVFNMPSTGPAEKIDIFADIGRGRINPHLGNLTGTPRLPNQARLDEFRFNALRKLNAMYRIIMPAAAIIACAAILVVIILEFKWRPVTPTPTIAVALLVSFFARIALLAFISVTSFEAMDIRYTLPLYPMLILFCFLSIVHLVRLGIPTVASRMSRGASIGSSAVLPERTEKPHVSQD